TLATFPLMLGLPLGGLIFDVVFFVVLISAIIHGVTIPIFARKLGLELPAEPDAPVTLEITSLKHVNGDIVEYTVGPTSRAVGHKIRELALPEGVVVALITRQQQFIPPHGSTRVLEGDRIFVVLRPETRPLVDRIFSLEQLPRDVLPLVLEFPLRGSATVGELNEFYGIKLDAPENCTLDELLRQRLSADQISPGSRIVFGEIALAVREVGDGGEIDQVGLAILAQKPSASTAD
ncbi:MAG TPA: TrkA C-terminal domain-containing protein, partial [Longimicrobiaceae bacterium]|nr:TrkA C-terminal domain-containing protein [Longimicrobiaceae bacterium]